MRITGHAFFLVAFLLGFGEGGKGGKNKNKFFANIETIEDAVAERTLKNNPVPFRELGIRMHGSGSGVECKRRKAYKRYLMSKLLREEMPEDIAKMKSIEKVTKKLSDKRRRGKKQDTTTVEPIVQSTVNVATSSEAPDKKSRVKRGLIVRDIEYRWPNAIVPYDFLPGDCSTAEMKDIRYSMKLLESYTPLRFVRLSDEYDVFAQNNLTHQNSLKFLCASGGGCYSYVGMVGGAQSISCCTEYSLWDCVHEIGHMSGMLHEQSSYKHDQFMRINTAEIQEGYQAMFGGYSSSFAMASKYDSSSPMHYSLWAYAKNGRPTMTNIDRETDYISYQKSGHFYFLRDILDGYSHVLEERCPEPRTCVNSGCLSYQGNECKCYCLPGLDPATNCSSVMTEDPTLATLQWPTGGYALYQPLTGCPTDFFSNGGVTRHTGSNSWLSDDYHLNPEDSIYTDAGSLVMEHTFCVHDPAVDNSTLVWPRGSYCIFMVGGVCAEGFEPGWVEFNETIAPSVEGTIPDGVNASMLHFCCRDDGFHKDPVSLPTSTPFVLFPETQMKECQNVRGMRSYWEFYIGGVGVLNWSGRLPYMKWSGDSTEIYLCSYYPYRDFGEIITLDADNPSRVITSPNFPEHYNNNDLWTWYIKTPGPDDQIVLKFSHFDIAEQDGRIDDVVEVRKLRPGYEGMLFYNKGLPRTQISDGNVLVLYLHTNEDLTATGFQANVSLLRKEDRCYGGWGEAGQYDGDVNFTRRRQKCLPWRSMTHCRHHPYHTDDLEDDLIDNLCRNPGHGVRPWCYVDRNCSIDYCDVCHIEDCIDEFSDCGSWTKDIQFCANHGKDCRATCNFCDECYANGTLYAGQVYYTETNRTCQAWLEDSPHWRDYSLSAFPDATPATLARGCRSTTDWAPAWCYTDDPQTRWENCDIPECHPNGSRSGACTAEDNASFNCTGMLTSYPDICDPGPHRDQCASHCGICSSIQQDVGGTGCGPPPQQNNATYTPVKANYATGESVEFDCDGYKKVQRCTSSGQWKPKLRLTCGACPEGWLLFGANCYTLSPVTELVNQSEAEVACTGLQGHLPIIDSQTRQSTIHTVSQLLQTSQDVWLGLTDGQQDGSFQWGEGPAMTYHNWEATREPDSWKGCYSVGDTSSDIWYDGRWNRTKSGIPCKPWVLTSYADDSGFPMDDGAIGAGNACRDPSNSGFLWCYTDDPYVYWEKCYVPQCHTHNPDLGCVDMTQEEYAQRYNGTWSRSTWGSTCKNWADTSYDSYHGLFPEGDTTLANNYCRNAGEEVPWCYTVVESWNWCDLPRCQDPLNDCYGVSEDYSGESSRTYSGAQCQNWQDGIYAPLFIGDETAQNFCRDPVGLGFLWCDTGDSQVSECNVNKCSDNEDCVTMSVDGTWRDRRCEDEAQYLCEREAIDVSAECEDIDEAVCLEDLTFLPCACQQYDVFAETKCRKTCGKCSDGSYFQPNTDTCDVGGVSVTVGHCYNYTQPQGEVLVSGNLQRACLPSLSLTGEAPQFQAIEATDTWNNELDIVDRFHLQPPSQLWIADNIHGRIHRAGVVKGWRFFSVLDGLISLVVLRKSPSNSFTPIHQTVVYNSGEWRWREISVKSEDQTAVQQGDVIGFRHISDFDYTYGGVAYDSCNSAISPDAVNWYRSLVSTETFEVDQMIANSTALTVTTDGAPDCAYASVAVLVGP